MRDLWLQTFHRTLVVASPEVDDYDADDLCAFAGGSGGTSKLDGGGWLEALNRDEFTPGRDQVSIDSVAALLSSPPSRLVVVDEFNMAAIVDAVESADRDVETLFLTSGITRPTTVGLEVAHGHLVVHHVAAVLGEMDYGLSHEVVVGEASTASFVRLTFEPRLGGNVVVVELFETKFDDIARLEAALAAVAMSDSDGSAAVVLSWALTGCALRDAYADLSTHTQGLTTVTDFVSLADFAVAVSTAYDEAVAGSAATSLTLAICEAVDESSERAVSRSSAIGCGDSRVRASVATTVLFATYDEIAAFRAGSERPSGEPWSSDAHTYFAAAGNEGLPYPMPPASFDWVIAVAACKPTGPDRALFSNAGDPYGRTDEQEVIALGAWFSAPLPDDFRQDLGYWGTSFAAPLAALASGVGPDGGEAIAPIFATLCEPVRWTGTDD